MDHQIQYNVDVERARSKNAQTVDLKEHRPVQQRAHGGYRWVEALQMPHLDNAAQFTRLRGNLIGFGQARGQRLLNQYVDAAGHQLPRARRMLHRRHADASRVHALQLGPLRCHAGFDCGEAANAELRFGCCARRVVRIDDGNQFNGKACLIQLAVHPQMIAPERTGTHHRHPQLFARTLSLGPRTLPHYFTGVSTACRHFA